MADKLNKIIYTKGINKKTRTVTAIISTGNVDRDGEVVLPSAVMSHAQEFMKNPVVTWSHQTRMPPVGKVTRLAQVDNTVEADVEFSDATQMSNEIWNLYAGGFLNAFSIGFMAIGINREPTMMGQTGPTFTEIEMLELGCVTVPANREALVKALEGDDEVEVSDNVKKWAFGEYAELFEGDVIKEETDTIFTDIQEVKEDVVEENNDESIGLEEQINQLIGEAGLEEEKASMTLQTLIFSKKMFKDAEACKKWATEHKLRADKVDETGNSFRLRQRDPGDFEKGSFRTKCMMDMPANMMDETHKCAVAAVFGKLKKEIEDGLLEEKQAVRYQRYPLAPISTSWSFSAEDGNRLIDKGGWELYRDVHAWWDQSAANGGPPEVKSAYKLPHHKDISGQLKTVFRGVVAATQRLFQSNTAIPDTDRRSVYNHLAKHYLEFDREAPEFKDWNANEFKNFCWEQYNIDLEDRDFKEEQDPEQIRKIAVAEILNRVNLIESVDVLRSLDENDATIIAESIVKLYALVPTAFEGLVKENMEDKEKLALIENENQSLRDKSDKAIKALSNFVGECGSELSPMHLSKILEVGIMLR